VILQRADVVEERASVAEEMTDEVVVDAILRGREAAGQNSEILESSVIKEVQHS
jgi:hypothetical protein